MKPLWEEYDLDIQGLWARAQAAVVIPGAPDFSGWRVSEVIEFLLDGKIPATPIAPASADEQAASFAAHRAAVSPIRDMPGPAGDPCDCGCGARWPAVLADPHPARFLSPTIRLNQVSAEGVVGRTVEFARELEVVARRVLARDGWEGLEAWAQALPLPQGQALPEAEVLWSLSPTEVVLSVVMREQAAREYTASIAAPDARFVQLRCSCCNRTNLDFDDDEGWAPDGAGRPLCPLCREG